MYTQPNDAIAYAQLLTHTLTAVFRSRHRGERWVRESESQEVVSAVYLILFYTDMYTHASTINSFTHALIHRRYARAQQLPDDMLILIQSNVKQSHIPNTCYQRTATTYHAHSSSTWFLGLLNVFFFQFLCVPFAWTHWNADTNAAIVNLDIAWNVLLCRIYAN